MRRVWPALGLLVCCTFPHYRVDDDDGGGSAGSSSGVGAASGAGGMSAMGAAGSAGETGGGPVSDSAPKLFLSPSEVTAIRARLAQEPWKEAHARLIADANTALTTSPRSVVDNGAPSANPGDVTRYGTDEPSKNREDYLSAVDMDIWIRSLGMAYAFTGDARYAERCVQLLVHWFVDPATRMYPSAQNFGPHTPGAGVPTSQAELWVTLPAMFYGSTFVTGHPAWGAHGADAEAAFQQWVATFLADLEQRPPATFDSSYAWWLLARTGAAALVQSEPQLSAAFDDWKNKASRQIDATGNLSLDAVESFNKAAFGLKALVLTAEIARHNSGDLYEHEDPFGGSALERAVIKMASYNLDPASWTGEGPPMAVDLEELAAAYEAAHSQYQDASLLGAVNLRGRPIWDHRMLGWATLSHGNLFELSAEP